MSVGFPTSRNERVNMPLSLLSDTEIIVAGGRDEMDTSSRVEKYNVITGKGTVPRDPDLLIKYI